MNILIIDDDPAGSSLLEMILKPTQATICRTCDGPEGLELLPSFRPDIILLDYIMPRWDGFRTTREIRGKSKTPILMLSVIDDPQVLAHALDDGADDFLVKPVSRSVLIAHINNLVRRSEPAQPRVPPMELLLQMT